MRTNSPSKVGIADQRSAHASSVATTASVPRHSPHRRWLAAAIGSGGLLLAFGPDAFAEIVLLDTQSGWQFSVDGSVNAFIVNSAPGSQPPGVRAPGSIGGVTGDTAQDTTRIRTGLLPTVFGFNMKSPDLGDGTKVGARLGIYPQIQNRNTFNNFGNGTQAGAQIDLREAYLTVDGRWGQFLAGRALDQFLGQNILSDMTLYGVGATGGNSGAGGTTLGRIGHGYPYPNFNANLRYTTLDLAGFKASIGIYDPSIIQGEKADAGGIPAPAARVTSFPRIEAEQSYAIKVGASSFTLFASELWQNAKFAAGTLANNGTSLSHKEVNSLGLGLGAKMTFGNIDALVAGYTGQALGSTLLLDTDALDRNGRERTDYGGYGQIVYHFGQGTSIGASYGGNWVEETSADRAARLAGIATEIRSQKLAVGQIYHDINKNLRLIAEYGHVTNQWFDNRTRDENIFSVGAFVFF